MDANFQKVREYLFELDYNILVEDEADGVFVVESEENGIKNAVLVVADPLLIVEQFMFELPENPKPGTYRELLIKNRDFVHGAFVLDETGKKVMFRNTHELENLDLNELEATLNSLALFLSEYSEELLELSKN